jgi:LacI family transcriptional regulator
VLETGGRLEDGGARIRHLPETRSFEGIVSHRWPNSPEAAFIESCTCPLVETSEFEFDDRPLRVTHDWREAGRLAGRHLIRLGIRQVAVCHMIDSRRDLAVSDGVSMVAEDAQAVSWRLGANLNEFPRSQYVDLMERELSACTGQVGIVACHAFLALAILGACRRIGLRIPQDVAIVTFASDAASIPASLVPLSEVAMDNYGLGYLAGRTLHRQLSGQAVPARQLVPPQGMTIRKSSSTSAVRDPVVREVAQLIQQRHTLPIGPKELSRSLAEHSRRTVERKFRAVTGESIGDALKCARLKTAQRLLRQDAEISLADVARQSGFSTSQYMCRVFRQQTGRSPGTYRLEPRRLS